MRHITATPCVRVVSRFNLPPLQGASLGGSVPRVENWAESYSPFGALQFGHLERVLSPGLYPICANLICEISARRRGHAGSPGAGRAKLRLSRGFPRLPACGITPQRSVVRLDDDVHGHSTS
jgi:hypothetical protein